MYAHRTKERKKFNLESKLLHNMYIIYCYPTPFTKSEKKPTILTQSDRKAESLCPFLSPLFFLSRPSTNHPPFEPNFKIRPLRQELNLCKCVYILTHLYGFVSFDR